MHREAVANALVKDGKVTAFELVDAGAGYSSVPQVTVDGVKDAQAKVELAFGKDLPKTAPLSSSRRRMASSGGKDCPGLAFFQRWVGDFSL